MTSGENMSPQETPSVSIDGQIIRSIREEKRLTQLYVAKVVGVTTDTVSRWENNRYPTIRRDNALNLAEALEVELEVILKQEVLPVADRQEKKGAHFWPVFSVVAFLLIVVSWFLFQSQKTAGIVLHAERLQPRYAAPGSRILVRLQVTMGQALKGVIIKEQFPRNWKLIDAAPPASSVGKDAATARWMLRNPAPVETITYLLEVAATESATEAQIQGEIIANPDGRRSTVPVSMSGKMQIEPLHWVDTDGNQIIDDMEILEISDLLDDTAELRREWKLIEEIWDAGGYRWDEESDGFVPLAATD